MQLLIFDSSHELLRMARARWHGGHVPVSADDVMVRVKAAPMSLSMRGARLAAIIANEMGTRSLVRPAMAF